MFTDLNVSTVIIHSTGSQSQSMATNRIIMSMTHTRKTSPQKTDPHGLRQVPSFWIKDRTESGIFQ